MTNSETLDNDRKTITMKQSSATLKMLSFINETMESKTISFQCKLDVSQLLVNYIKAVKMY